MDSVKVDYERLVAVRDAYVSWGVSGAKFDSIATAKLIEAVRAMIVTAFGDPIGVRRPPPVFDEPESAPECGGDDALLRRLVDRVAALEGAYGRHPTRRFTDLERRARDLSETVERLADHVATLDTEVQAIRTVSPSPAPGATRSGESSPDEAIPGPGAGRRAPCQFSMAHMKYHVEVGCLTCNTCRRIDLYNLESLLSAVNLHITARVEREARETLR